MVLIQVIGPPPRRRRARRALRAPRGSGRHGSPTQHEHEACQRRNRPGNRDQDDDGERRAGRRAPASPDSPARGSRRGRGTPTPHDEEARRRQRDEDERRAHEEGHDLRERAREHERRWRSRRAAPSRAPGPVVAGWSAASARGKEAVAAHGEVEARRHQEQRHHARDDRQRRRPRRAPDGPDRPSSASPARRANSEALVACSGGTRYRNASVVSDVDRRDDRDAERERPRQLAARIAHFAGDAARLPESAEGIERADQPERRAPRAIGGAPGAPREERRRSATSSPRRRSNGADDDRGERRGP